MSASAASPIRCYNEPSPSGLALQTLTVLHKYASGPYGSETHGGFDFTGADCRKWMKEVGFKQTQVTRLAGPDGMVVGFK